MSFFMTIRIKQEGERFVGRVLFDSVRHQNLNLLIKDFMVATGMQVEEDMCLVDAYTGDYLLSSDLLVKNGIYRIMNADAYATLRVFRYTIVNQ